MIAVILLIWVLSVVGTDVCNIPKVPLSVLNGARELPEIPVIYTFDGNWQEQLRQRSARDFLLQNHGDTQVTLSSSNTYSHGKYEMSLAEYITTSVDVSSQHANESFYLFGNNYDGVFSELTDLYRNPPCHYCDVAGAKTIGIGGYASGVSFHFHGPGFSEVIHGAKQWFLLPASFTRTVAATFDPNMTVARWVDDVYPTLTSAKNAQRIDIAGDFNRNTDPQGSLVANLGATARLDSDDTPILGSTPMESESLTQDGRSSEVLQQLADSLYECVIRPGEVLYFPPMWMHATLNLDEYNVFMSLFLDPQLMRD